jgi:glutamate carboxypeptidase
MSAGLAGSLLSLLRSRQEDMVSLLSEWAAIESPTDDPASQAPMLARLSEELGRSGLAVRRSSGQVSGGSLLGVRRHRRRSPTPVQLLLGHADTVWPRGSLTAMPIVRRDGRLYGPGVFDMKGGLVQICFALRALAELGAELPAEPVVFINTDEEIGSLDSVRHVRRLGRVAARVFVLEPALGPEGQLKTRRKGVGHFVLTARGRAAHAGLEPEQGASAILALARAVIRVSELADPAHGVEINVGVIHGGLRANVVAPLARAVVDVRVGHPAQGEDMKRRLAALVSEVPGVELEVVGSVDRPPLEPTPRNQALYAQAQEAARALGIPLSEGAAGGASDGNTTSLTTATLDGLGAVGGGAHAKHENVEMARLPERAALLALLLLAPLATAEGTAARGGGESNHAV